MGSRQQYHEAARRAETVAAICEPVVWGSMITVLVSVVPYFLVLTLSGQAGASPGLLAEILRRTCLIGSIGAALSAPLMIIAGRRAAALQGLSLREPDLAVPAVVYPPGTYSATGTTQKRRAASKVTNTQWIC